MVINTRNSEYQRKSAIMMCSRIKAAKVLEYDSEK